MDSPSPNQPEQPSPRSTAEWTTLGISAVVVLILVGAALAEIFVRDDPAGGWISIDIALTEAEVRNGQAYIPYSVRNDGGAAVTDIVVLVEILQGETVIEETTIDIPLLASHGIAHGEVVTALDLATHTVEARVGAVQIP